MGQLIDLLFKPPPLPPIDLPISAKLVPAVKTTIVKAFELAYHRGVIDGLVAGVLITLLVLPSIRNRVTRGIADAYDYF